MKPAVQQYIEDQFGGSFEVSTKSISVGTNATKLVGNDYERVGLLLMLLGTTQCYVSPDSALTTTAAIALTGNGSLFSSNVRDDLVLPAREFWGITASGTATIWALEIKRYLGA